MKLALLLLAALLAMAAAQTTSPAVSGSPSANASGSPAASPSASAAAASGSQFENCNTLLLNGTGNFDILLLGSASPSASASGSPAVSGSPAASTSGSPATSRSPGLSASPSLVNASPSLSRSPSASAGASPASSAAATASASPAISPSTNARLLDLASSLVGGRLAVNGNARISNSILGGGLACLTSASPAASGSVAASPASSAATSAAATRSPSASISGSPASSAAAASRSPSASLSGSPSASTSSSPATSRSPATSPDFALLVNGNLEITNSQVACGGLAVGGSVAGSPLLSQTNAQNLRGSEALAAANNIDFAGLRQRLLADSSELCSLPSTGQLSLNAFGGAVLDASSNSTSSSNVTIFTLPSSALANLTSVLINGTSANGFVIINVIDESGNTISSGLSASNSNLTLSEFSTDAGSLNATNLLWNFCNASRIDISNILLQGTILAPRASVSVNRAELEGALIAQSLNGNFFNHVPVRFEGVFCPAGSQSSTSASPAPSSAAQASASPSA